MKKLTIASFLAIICAVGLIAQDGAQTNIGAGLNSAFTAFIGPSGIANGPIILVPGSASASSTQFTTDTAGNISGIYKPTTNYLGLAAGSLGVAAIHNDGGATLGVRLRSDAQLGFSSTTGLTASTDSAFTRLGVASIALGNGTQGDFSGTLKLGNLIPTGAITGVANVGANSCGTTTATILGSNNSSVITVGATAGTQCRLQFSFAATTAWDCTANDDTTTIAVRTTPVDTTHTDVIGSFTAGDKVTSHCFPR